MMTFTRRLFLGALASALTVAAQTDAAAPKKLRVLFIGNSYTYFNNLPKLVEAIANAHPDGPKIETEASLRGGVSLKWQWENGKALDPIRKGGWDFVSLQEHSTLGKPPAPGEVPSINDPAAYFEYAEKFDAEIKKAGAKTLLYATWSRDGYPEQQRRLDDAFVQMARRIDAAIVPVGLAFTIARIEAPNIRLQIPDRSHPTAAGSYVAALLFYQSITGRSPTLAPAVINGTPWNSEQKVTLVNLSWSDATSLRIFASRAWDQEPLRAGAAVRSDTQNVLKQQR
jgi:hypothetical protein